MKAVSMIVGAFAALVIAAPTASVVDSTPKEIEARAFAFDLNQYNNFGFVNPDFAYLAVLNRLNFQNLHSLAINNGLQLQVFQGLFAQQAQFDIVGLLQLAQLNAISQIANLGVLNGFNLQAFNFVPLDLGLLLQGFNGLNLQQFIGANLAPQISAIAAQQGFLNLGGNGVGSVNFSGSRNSNTSDSGNAVTAEQQEAQEVAFVPAGGFFVGKE